jgi:DNA-damage-inducible protein D
MSNLPTLFHFDASRTSFEDLGKPNGATHWRGEDLMQALGYESDAAFAKAITRAKQACLSLGLEIEDHFARQADGSTVLTRFGCYLVAMNGDPRKEEVAAAQVYFAAIAETFQNHLEHAEGIDRVLIREEVTDGQKSLAGTAKRHGVDNYGFFQNKGYMGMYNMSLARLEQIKGVPRGEQLIDRMGKSELAAHLFRITQTDEKIKRENIRGQRHLEDTAYVVGKRVRDTMLDLSGTAPESLPIAENIKQVRAKLKQTNKKLTSLDKKKPKRKGKKDIAPPNDDQPTS